MSAPQECLFCGIVGKTVPAKLVYEDAETVAFCDIHPQAPVHVILVPRRHLARISEAVPSDAPLIGQLVLAANTVARQLGLAEDGYRLVINCNAHGGQTVYHVHVHLLGGRPMRWPPG